MKTLPRTVRDLLISIAVPGVLCSLELMWRGGAITDQERLPFLLFIMACGPIAYTFITVHSKLQCVRRRRIEAGESLAGVRIAELVLCALILPLFVGILCWMFLPVFEGARQ